MIFLFPRWDIVSSLEGINVMFGYVFFGSTSLAATNQRQDNIASCSISELTPAVGKPKGGSFPPIDVNREKP